MYSIGLDELVLNFSSNFEYNLECVLCFNFNFLYFLSILPIKPSENYNEYTEEEIKQVIFGSLLGDGKLELSLKALNARFGFIQSVIHKEYFLSLFSILKPYCSADYRTYSYKDPRTGKTYITLNFWTVSKDLFTDFYKMFYVNKIKRVPTDLSLLSPLALAHWIMQDGSKGTSGGLYICTDLFDPADTRRLALFLEQKYSLKVTTPKAPGTKGALRIYVSVQSMNSLRNLIKTHMHPSMLYKLGL